MVQRFPGEFKCRQTNLSATLRHNLLSFSSYLFFTISQHKTQRYHGNMIVNFDSDRGGISLEQEKSETGTTSRLLLTKATFRDSGNYSCVPLGALSASIIVHVLNGNWKRLYYF